MMRVEIVFEQRDETLFATMHRDNPLEAAPAERAAHDCFFDAFVKVCAARKLPVFIASSEPKPSLRVKP